MTEIDPDARVNDEWTAGEVEQEFEGREFLAIPDEDHFLCDFCSTGVPYSSQPRVGGYVADDILNDWHPRWQAQQGRPLVPLASYCENCTTQRLFFPCEGFAEIRLLFDLDTDRHKRDVRVTDVSPRDDGIPWNPKELTEKISGVSFDANALLGQLLGRDEMWGPENMVTFMLSVGAGIDIRELIDYQGNYDPQVLGRARKEYQRFNEKMQAQGFDRKSFRDHVRDN